MLENQWHSQAEYVTCTIVCGAYIFTEIRPSSHHSEPFPLSFLCSTFSFLWARKLKMAFLQWDDTDRSDLPSRTEPGYASPRWTPPIPPQFRAPVRALKAAEVGVLQEATGSCRASRKSPVCGLELNMAERLLAINLNLCPPPGRLKVFTGWEQTQQWRRRRRWGGGGTWAEAAGDAAQAD